MIYIVLDPVSNCVKIGYTSDKESIQRLNSLQTGNPNKLILIAEIKGDFARESEIHKDLNEYKCQGGSEWFYCSSYVLKKIKEITSNGASLYRSIIIDFIGIENEFISASMANELIGDGVKNITSYNLYGKNHRVLYKRKDVYDYIESKKILGDKKGYKIIDNEEYHYLMGISRIFKWAAVQHVWDGMGMASEEYKDYKNKLNKGVT